MIAFWGLPGGAQFIYARFATKAEARAWIQTRWTSGRQTLADAQAYQQSRVLSNREASKVRYQDGQRVVRPGVEGLETGEETSPEIDALETEGEREYWDSIAKQAQDDARLLSDA